MFPHWHMESFLTVFSSFVLFTPVWYSTVWLCHYLSVTSPLFDEQLCGFQTFAITSECPCTYIISHMCEDLCGRESHGGEAGTNGNCICNLTNSRLAFRTFSLEHFLAANLSHWSPFWTEGADSQVHFVLVTHSAGTDVDSQMCGTEAH